MKTTTQLTIAFLFFAGCLVAQNDLKITTGVMHSQNGDYELAVQVLKEGLADESKLKEKNRAKGWFHLGMSLEGVMANPENHQKPEYQNAILDAFNAYVMALNRDTDGRLTPQIKERLKRSYIMYLQASLSFLNMKEYAAALSYADAAVSTDQYVLDNSDHVPYDLRGQIHLAKNDTLASEKDFLSGAAVFEKNPPKSPDILIAYLYYRLALIQRYYRKNVDTTLNSITQGLAGVSREFQRIDKEFYTAEQYAQIQEQYESAIADLRAFELDVLLNAPDKRTLALQKFQQAIQDDPKNYIVHMAYASLLEQQDPAKAIPVYQRAITIDPNAFTAYFNLGALYVNRGVALMQQANDTMEQAATEAYQEKARAEFQLAWPNFESAHVLNPNDLSTIHALIQTAIALDKVEEYKKYKEIRDRLTGN